MKYDILLEMYIGVKRLALECSDSEMCLYFGHDKSNNIDLLTESEIDEIIEMLTVGKEHFVKRKERVVTSG